MMRIVQIVCIWLLAAGILSAQQGIAYDGSAQESVGDRLLNATNEMWFLLSGVTDRASADAAADRFLELAEQSCSMTDTLLDGDAQSLEQALLDKNTYRIANAYEDLNHEFESLCRMRCYGSSRLAAVFISTVRMGVFGDEYLEILQATPHTLNDSEVATEIARLLQLEDPDREILRVLSMVCDDATALSAAMELAPLADELRRLQPDSRLGADNFSAEDRDALMSACAVLEPLLWSIRNEIVRIVSLPGYDKECYDTFSDALDLVFDSLNDTHAECFDYVFDKSFRADLDNALHQSITTSQ